MLAFVTHKVVIKRGFGGRQQDLEALKPDPRPQLPISTFERTSKLNSLFKKGGQTSSKGLSLL